MSQQPSNFMQQEPEFGQQFGQQQTPFGQVQNQFGGQQNAFGQNAFGQQPQLQQMPGGPCPYCKKTNHAADKCFYNPSNPKAKNYQGPQGPQQGGNQFGRNFGGNQMESETQVQSTNANLGSRYADNSNTWMGEEAPNGDILDFKANNAPVKQTPFTEDFSKGFPLLGTTQPMGGNDLDRVLNNIEKTLK